jgi:transcriptional regulator with XRE-family HTH domain
MTELAKRLRDAMKKKDASVLKISRATGVARQTICAWLNGNRPSDFAQFIKLCEFLDLSLDEVFCKTGKPDATLPIPFLPRGPIDYSGFYEVSIRKIQPKII